MRQTPLARAYLSKRRPDITRVRITPPDDLEIRPFVREDRAAVRGLILAGLRERWGRLDPDMNPDLEDIARCYAEATFLVAALAEGPSDRLVGTGALVRESEGVGRVVRMAVAADYRRLGIGRALLDALLAAARERGFRRVVLETTDTWQEAIAFYRRCGFRVVGHSRGEVHMSMEVRTGG